MHLGTGFVRNTLPNGNACLVGCFLQLCAIYQLRLGFYDLFAWKAIGRVLLT